MNEATVQKILKIEEHGNADVLEIATVLGWQVIVKKGEFKEGDLCVFISIDSFLPMCETFKFLEKNYRKLPDGTEGLWLRSIKLRGRLSSGLIFPLELLNDYGTIKQEGKNLFLYQ